MAETQDVGDGGGRSEGEKETATGAFFRGDEPTHSFSVDDALSLLADPQRRRLLVLLLEQAPRDVTLESAVEALAATEAGRVARKDVGTVRIQLIHSHLPRLENAGVVTYHSASQMITYHRDPTLERLLKTVLELDSST